MIIDKFAGAVAPNNGASNNGVSDNGVSDNGASTQWFKKDT